MSNEIYIATGQVIDRDTNEGVANLSVEAWDTNTQRTKALGSAKTDDNGRFSISLHLPELKYEQAPDLFFKVFRDQTLLDSTENSVLWNANTQENVTIRIRTIRQRPEGKDRVTTAQVFKGVDFFQKSDFKGVYNEYKGKAGTSLGFITDIFKNSLSNMDINPLQVTGVKHADVMNQDVNVARRNLEAKNVVVKEVVPYQPGLNASSLSNITSLPLSLKPGQEVRLYEQDGIVKYYSVVKPAATATATATGDAGVTVSPAMVSVVTKNIQDHTNQLNSLQEALNTSRQEAAKKDETISALQAQVETLQKQQKDVDALLKSDNFIKMMAKMGGQ